MSLVTPGVAWHRRHSSWYLWGSHILLLCIHMFPQYPTVGDIMCNQLWSIHTYLIVCLFALFFIIFIIIISLLKVVHIQLWHCFNTWWNAYSTHILVLLLCSFGVHRLLWFVILHFENTAHKNFGGYVWHGEINTTSFPPFTHLVLQWIIHFYIFLNSLLYLYNQFICFKYIFDRIPCIGQWYFWCVSHVIHHCTVVGIPNIYLSHDICLTYATCLSNHPYVWVICLATTHWGVTYIGVICFYKVCCPLVSISGARWLVERGCVWMF